MTNEEKQLLLRDLCARLPYNVKIQGTIYKDILDNDGEETGEVKEEIVTFILHIIGKNAIMYDGCWTSIEFCKPYLRPMSSMTEEEREEYRTECKKVLLMRYRVNNHYPVTDWLNAHHFDYRGLIEKRLALEAPEGMYKTE